MCYDGCMLDEIAGTASVCDFTLFMWILCALFGANGFHCGRWKAMFFCFEFLSVLLLP